TQSMPPYDLWLRGRSDILGWWVGPGAGCRNSRVIPAVAANGSPAFGQYKPNPSGAGYEPWALQVLELADDQIVEFTFFLRTERLFPLFGCRRAGGLTSADDHVAQAQERHHREQFGAGVADADLALRGARRRAVGAPARRWPLHRLRCRRYRSRRASRAWIRGVRTPWA
ncbi:MAG: hypothetical protein M3N47_12460, partial [Chloroflexota bacterium]|nr:hypothetical protein [Chloroflexota bacterium]